jgi:hypothetical protein
MAKLFCGFCQKPNKISNEHVFGQWLTALLTSGEATGFRHELRRPGHKSVVRESVSLDTQVRMPCRPCNEGWMNDLEKAMQRVLPPLIRNGDGVRLSIETQAAIAAWAVKTAMVVEFLRPRDIQYFTPNDRLSLMVNRVPTGDMGAHVWIGAFVGPNDGMRSSASRLSSAPHGADAYELLVALRKLLVQVFVKRGSATNDIYVRPGDWDRWLLEIWPPSREIVWPPADAFTDFALPFERFMALDVHRDAYGPEGPP